MRFIACSVLTLVALMVNSASAETHYQCTFGQQERHIRVIQTKPGQVLPCEVQFEKDGGTSALWRAENEAGFCEQQAASFMEQHREWGWRCQDTSGIAIAMVNQYQRQAILSQAIAIASPFKWQVSEYAMANGDYPDSLEAIGLDRSDMLDSQYIRDLRIVEGGRIRVLVDARLGEQGALELAPLNTLGGMSMEWQCSTNVLDTTVGTCRYDQSLTF